MENKLCKERPLKSAADKEYERLSNIVKQKEQMIMDHSLATNGWCYEQVCLAQNVQVTENVIGKLDYSTCYAQYGLISTKLQSNN